MEAPQISQTEGEEAKVTEQQLRAQMLFNKSYASGTYSFVSALDLKGIGYVEGEGNQVLSADEWKRRAEMAVKAYIPMLTGNMGASLSHAIPHVDCVELILAVSAEKPIMIPFSPMYKGYGQKYMGLLGTRDDVNVYTYGIDIAGAIRKEKLSELFEDVINTIRAAE
jgi:CRISPR-associated protein Cst2